MSNPGAIVYAAQRREDRLCDDIDAGRDPGRWTFGGDEPGLAKSAADCANADELAEYLAQFGIRLTRLRHPRTRERWVKQSVTR